MSVADQTLAVPGLRFGADAFAADVLRGLSRTPKAIPPMYFYDERGSRLFGQITEQDEYYLTRCEAEILQTCVGDLASFLRRGAFRLIELGAGDGTKTETLLGYFLTHALEFDYFPIDICQQAVTNLTHSIRRKLPRLVRHVHGITAEYAGGVSLFGGQRDRRNVVLFLGSSIGNFDPPATRKFLRDLHASLNEGDYLLIGFDLKKDVAVLSAAHNDRQGITREFNFNLLDRINRELGGDFDRNRFMHYSPYNAQRGCMESWLVSREDQQVRIDALDRAFLFRAWEGIRVERSYKYSVADVDDLAAGTGYTVRQHFVDRRGYFLDSLWELPDPARPMQNGPPPRPPH